MEPERNKDPRNASAVQYWSKRKHLVTAVMTNQFWIERDRNYNNFAKAHQEIKAIIGRLYSIITIPLDHEIVAYLHLNEDKEHDVTSNGFDAATTGASITLKHITQLDLVAPEHPDCDDLTIRVVVPIGTYVYTINTKSLLILPGSYLIVGRDEEFIDAIFYRQTRPSLDEMSIMLKGRARL